MLKLFAVLLMYTHGVSCSLCQAVGCPQNKPFCSPAGCVYDCSKDFYVNGTNCVFDCADWFISNGHCVEVCPKSHLIRETLKRFGSESYLEKNCVKNCNNNEFIYNGTCVIACPSNVTFVNDKVCVEECPPEKRFRHSFKIFNITHTKCIDKCLWDGRYNENNVCTNVCSKGKVIANDTCLDICHAPQPYIRDGFCVANCSSETVYIKNNTCLKTCPDEKPFLYNGSCVEFCPHGFPFTEQRNSHRYCISNCTSDKYLLNTTCVNTCPDKYFANGSFCVQNCPKEYPFVLRLSLAESKRCTYSCRVKFVMSCVSSCPTKSFIHDNMCLDVCPSSMNAFGNSCILNCPKSHPFSQKLKINLNVWNHNYGHQFNMDSKSQDIQQCVSTCTDSRVLHNGSCVERCPKTHMFITNGTCSSEPCSTFVMYNISTGIACSKMCPSDTFISDKYCMRRCPKNKYKYGNMCVETCPHGKQYVQNKTETTECGNYSVWNNGNSELEVRCKDIVTFSECSVECPKNSSYKYHNTCLPFCPKGTVTIYTRCVKNCPRSLPLEEPLTVITHVWNKRDHYTYQYALKNTTVETIRCVGKCSNPKYPFDPFTKNCTKKCSDTAKYILQNTCVNSCPNGTFLDTVQMGIRCVQACSDVKPLYKGQCVNDCPLSTNNETMYIFEKACVDKCPETHPLGMTVKPFSCIKSCDERYAFKDGQCIAESDCSEPYLIYDRLCLDECPPGLFWYNECLPIWSFCFVLLTTIVITMMSVYCSRSLFKDSFTVAKLMFSEGERKKYFLTAEANLDVDYYMPSIVMESNSEANVPLLHLAKENEGFEVMEKAEDVM